MNSKNIMNNTFCILPWVHLTINIDGRIKICCNTYDKVTPRPGAASFNFGYDKISDVWNGSYMKDLRNNMINGIKVPSCKGCYYVESLGHSSARTDSNSKRIWKKVKIDDNPKIQYLDFKLSNECNLKCRMCNAYSSSLLEKEYNTSMKAGIQIPDAIDDYVALTNWQQTDIFKENLEEVLSHIKKLKFTGGEPTIDKNVHNILKYCINKGYNKNIDLGFTTNGTNVNQKFKELIIQFKRLNMVVSVEAVDKVGEYIRFPSNWSSINKNIIGLPTLPNISSVEMTTTIQVLNIYNLFDLFDWFKNLDHNTLEYGYELGFSLLREPEGYSITCLPDEILDKAIIKLQKLSFDERYNEQYIQVMNILKNIERNDNKTTDEFFVLNGYYDLVRNQNFNEVCPELYADLMRYKT